MDTQNDGVLLVLNEIKNTLNKLFVCFEDDYNKIQEKKSSERKEKFLKMLEKDAFKEIFPLLFNKANYSQNEIAEKAKSSQPTVSRVINQLIEDEIIEQLNIDGKTVYKDKFNYLKLIK